MIDFTISPKHFGLKILDLKNETYLDFIRCKPCAICGDTNRSDPHHVMNERRNDYLAVPLCRVCHADYHTLGSVEKFNEKYNVDLMWMIVNYLSYYIQERL